MKRIETRHIDAEVLRQARWIYRNLVIGGTMIVGAIIYLLAWYMEFTYYDAVLLAWTVVASGGLMVGLGIVMLGRMPPAERRTVFADVYELAERPFMHTTQRQVLVVNWQKCVTPEQWACVRFHVRRGGYYISRESVKSCGLSSETYRDLRAELIRCHVLPENGNDIVDSDEARAVFSPARSE